MTIRALISDSTTIDALSDILVETVAHGGSVSFMHPLDHAQARAFWAASLEAAREDRRVVLGAWEGELLTGTVTLILECPPNQPHRAEIAKMMTRVSHRGRGIARSLLLAAESVACERARTLLVLDTAEEDGASGLYERMGYTHAGTIPDYAFKPHGGLTGTRLYWKRLPSSTWSLSDAR